MHSKIEVKDKAPGTSGIKIAGFRKHVRKTEPHTHNSYLELIYLTRGPGRHTIDSITYPIDPPVLYIVKERQLHFWDIQSEPEGYVLILKKAFVEKHFDQELRHLVTRLEEHAEIKFPGKDVLMIDSLFALLMEELEESTEVSDIFLSLLKALIAKMLSHSTLRRQPAHREIYSRFIALLAAPGQVTNKVAHYAAILHTSPQNLNAVCKSQTGKVASAILAEFIIAAAKRLLLYTGLPITEISYQLGFLDSSHFSKYFKKHTGSSPSALRKQN